MMRYCLVSIILISIAFVVTPARNFAIENAPVTIDGSSVEWASLGAETFSDPEGDSTGTDIAAISIFRTGDSYYFLLTFYNRIDTNPALRYFINFNTETDEVSDFQVAIAYGTMGDTCRFRKDWSTYDYRRADTVPGLKAAIGETVEFKVPASMFGGKNAFGFFAGIWDTKKGGAVDTVSGFFTKTKIFYTMTVADPEKHFAEIEARFTDCPDETINLHFPLNFPDVGKLKIENLQARDLGGALLKIAHIKDSYKITLGKSTKNFTLNYTLPMKQYHNIPVRGPAGYVCKSYMLTATCWSLLSPAHFGAKEYSLKLNLPLGWSAVVPWKKSGELYFETDPRVFRETTFGAGMFDIQKKDIGGTEVTIAIDTHFDETFRKDLSQNAFMSFQFIQSSFGAEGPPSHLSIFAKPEGPYEWQSFNENGLSQGEAVADMHSAMYQYSHRIFHSFNGFYPFGMDIQPTWFLEGVNEYYDALVMMKVKSEPPLKSLADFYAGEYVKKHSTLDASLKGNTRFSGNWEKERFLAYKKGALAALLLDLEIRRITNRKKSLGDLLSALYKTYGHLRGGTITDAVIEKTASTLVGKDMNSFFSKYIYQKTYFNMDWHFRDDDKNGLSNAVEELLPL